MRAATRAVVVATIIALIVGCGEQADRADQPVAVGSEPTSTTVQDVQPQVASDPAAMAPPAEPVPAPTTTTTVPPAPTTTTVPPAPATTTTAPPPPSPAPESAPSGDIPAAIAAAFGPGELGAKATRVAQCESQMNPNAVSRTNDHGLMQINIMWRKPGHSDPVADWIGRHWDQVYDPFVNAQMARRIYDAYGWGMWSCGRA